MANKEDCIRLMKMVTDANPGVKFGEGTPVVWANAFHSVPRLKLFLVVQEYIRIGSRFTPAISEIWELVHKFDLQNTYWQPPKDARDERCMWYMAINGVSDPDEIPAKVISEVYA